MESVNYNYLDKHKKFRIDSKKLATAFIISAFIVAIIVFWWLKLIGITVTGEAFCGLDEHIHNSECYTSEVICGFDDDKSGTLPSQTETAEAPTESETTTSDSIFPGNSDKTDGRNSVRNFKAQNKEPLRYGCGILSGQNSV